MSLVIVQRLAQTAATVGERTETHAEAAIDYAAFFRAEFSAVTRTAYLVLHDRDAAEDVAQDAFTQLFRNWTKISAYDRPDVWARRVAIRLAVRAAAHRQLGMLLGRLEPLPGARTSTWRPPSAACRRSGARRSPCTITRTGRWPRWRRS